MATEIVKPMQTLKRVPGKGQLDLPEREGRVVV
jgi:hypothetical protein